MPSCCARTLALTLLPSIAAAQTGTITGRVTDQAGGAALEAARVVLSGTTRIETTNREGRYTFRGVAPGNYQVRVLRVGYRPEAQSTTPGATGGRHPRLRPDAARRCSSTRSSSTATGEQRKLEIGNAVSTIDAAKIAEQAPITEFANLISGRAAGRAGAQEQRHHRHRHPHPHPGLQQHLALQRAAVLPRRHPARERLHLHHAQHRRLRRGRNRTRAPRASTTSIPDDIENIEIVKGPAAATLYGIQASNGVVRITTKHGTAGPPRWNLFSELGAVADNNTYPLNYYGRDTTAATGADFDGFCNIQRELDGDCTQTSSSSYQPLKTRPPGPQGRAAPAYGANVSGGSDQVTYYVSGELRERDRRLPPAEVRGGLDPPSAARSPTTSSARTRSRSSASGPT